MTRGDVLRYNLAYALIRASKIVRGVRQALIERERYAVADHVVAHSKRRRPLAFVGRSAPTGGADDAITIRTTRAWNEEDYVFLTNS
jgi:dihydroneopterin aldolase